MVPKKLLLDTDPAIGVAFRDVDDALAILLAMASPELELSGITINFGNVAAEKGFPIANEVVGLTDADVPVLFGSTSRKDLGVRNPAVDHLIETVREHPGEISLVAIAPLTNVATAMMLDDTFAENLGELIVMGGATDFAFFASVGELNFHLDGQAAATVMRAPCPKTLITMDLCSQAVFTKRHLGMLQRSDSKVSRYLAKRIPHWLTVSRILFRGGGFYPWDPIAVACALDPSLVDEKYFTFDVQERGLRSGRILNLREEVGPGAVGGKPAINIPQTLDGDRFMQLLMDRLLAL